MPTYPIQAAFTGGEVAPSLCARVDLQKYGTACKKLRNMVVQPHGGASNRPGIEYINSSKEITAAEVTAWAATTPYIVGDFRKTGTTIYRCILAHTSSSAGAAGNEPGVGAGWATYWAKDATRICRTVPFIFSTTQAYIIDFGHLYCRFYKEGGVIVKTVTDTAEWVDDDPYVVGNFVKLNDVIYRCWTAHTSVAADNEPGVGATWGTKWIADATYELVTTYDEADIFDLRFDQSADTLYVVHPEYKTRKITRTGHNAWTIAECDFTGSPLMEENDTDTTITVGANCQVLRPNADSADGSWLNTALNNTNLYSYVDEATVDDTDYIWPSGANACTLAFSSGFTPYSRSGHMLFIRLVVGAGTVRQLTFSLLCGVTTIRTWTLRTDANKSYNLKLFLTKDEAENITDYSTLSIVLDADAAGGTTFITQIYFRIPMDAAGDGTPVALTDSQLFEGDSVTLTASAATFDAHHVGGIFAIRYWEQNESLKWKFWTTGLYTGPNIPATGSWIITLATDSSSYRDEAACYIEKSIDDGASWFKIYTFPETNSSSDVSATGIEEESTWLRWTREISPGSADTNVFTFSQNANERYVYFKITAVASSTSATATLQNDFTRPGVAFKTWSEGSWSGHRGWPSTVGFYQDRLCFGNTPSEPQTGWSSETGDYESFMKHFPIRDTDMITFPLPSRQVNAIESFVVLDNIIALTSGANWTVGPASDVVFTPSNCMTKIQEYRGADSVQPVIIGSRALYVQAMGSTVRDIGYDANGINMSGDDLSIFSKHLLSGYSVVEMAYAQEPDSVVWIVRDDGLLLGLTYMREQQVLAWHWHETDGDFESVAVIPGDGYNEVWFVVKRTINGVVKRYIERLTQRAVSTDVRDYFHVDCGRTYDGVATATITGLSHLEGKAVAVLANGSVVTGKTVASGQITVPAGTTICHVGLPYTADLETLNVEVATREGTLQAKKIDIPEVLIKLERTVGGKIGVNFTTMDSIITPETYATTTPIPVYTYDKKQQLPSEYSSEEDWGGRVCIRQDQPLPITVLAIIPTITGG